jgi:hypothetical protein
VEKRWMDTVTTTDPDILKARYLFERLVEKRETIENGMKWMRKEVLQAFRSYISLAGYNKVCLMFTLKFHWTFFFHMAVYFLVNYKLLMTLQVKKKLSITRYV